MPRVTLQPFGTVVDIGADETVFQAARRAGVDVPTACGGAGTCGLCRVKVLEGEAALPPYTREEKKHLGNTYFISRLRLSCRLRVHGDDAHVVVLVPDAEKALAARRG